MQCGLKSQLVYICATSATLRNAIKSPVTFLIRVIISSDKRNGPFVLRYGRAFARVGWA